MTLEEQLDQVQALADQVAATRLTLAKEHLYDEHWRAYNGGSVWYRKISAEVGSWQYNVKNDTLHLGKRRGFVRNAFRYLYQLKQAGTLPGVNYKPKTTKDQRKFGPDYEVSMLSPSLRAAHERTPPSQEWLALRYGWDEDIKAFFHVVGDRLEYQMPGSFVKLEDGVLYATWRVKSMLVFGNPEGLAGEAVSAERNRAILNTAPDVVSGITADLAGALPDYNKSTIKYRKVVDRAKELEEAAAKKERAAAEKIRERVRKRELQTIELNAKRVQEIKENRAKADALIAKFERDYIRRKR